MVTVFQIKLAEMRIATLQVAAQRTPAAESLDQVMQNAHILFHFVGLPCNLHEDLNSLLYSQTQGNA